MSSSLEAFLEALGNAEEPMGMFYTDTEPEGGFSPKESVPVANVMEQAGELDTAALWKNWSCVMGNLWLARKRRPRPILKPNASVVSEGPFTSDFTSLSWI